MTSTLYIVLVLLASAVVGIALMRSLRLPAVFAYLLIGIAVGPYALGWVPDTQQTRHLAEFGIVFLMFSVGLEFSLPQLKAMRSVVFGLGLAQVVLTMLAITLLGTLAGLNWKTALVIGGILTMSSTAVVSKLLVEKMQLGARHGRQIIGVLLFQDLAVVPLLVLIPTLAIKPDAAAAASALPVWLMPMVWALTKTVILLALLLFFGQRLMGAWFHVVAKRRLPELFMLNVLLVTLGLAYVTEIVGLSLALGAFVAGMLISETQYRYQVEASIQPFRDILLGLFFVSVGMGLRLDLVVDKFGAVMLVLVALLAGKTLITYGLSRVFRNDRSLALRVALALAPAGEFGLVLLGMAGSLGLIEAHISQILLAAMILSMLLTPLLIESSGRIANWLFKEDWNLRAKEIHDIAIHSAEAEGHVIVCGYGRSGQNLVRFLDQEGIASVALDVDPQRVRAAAAAGENVAYGDAAKREVLIAAGLSRARAVIVTFVDSRAALQILALVQELRPDCPVVVRTSDDTDLEKLRAAGAAEIVPETLEGSLMLASHALLLLGVPLARVVRSIRRVREHRYSLLRGFFHGHTDVDLEGAEQAQPRLVSIALDERSAAVKRTLGELKLDELGVQVTAVRRRNIRGADPQPEMRLQAGDVVVLLGTPETIAAAEMRLLG